MATSPCHWYRINASPGLDALGAHTLLSRRPGTPRPFCFVQSQAEA